MILDRRALLKSLAALAAARPLRLRRPGRPFTTVTPLTYIIDYAKDHLDNPDYIRKVAEAPPNLLHLGLDTPFSARRGPVREVAAPKGSERAELLSPRDTRARFESIRRMVADLHKARVDIVIPYVCNQTLAGHAEKRLGFWEFYDRWDDYKEFGLPPKPPADPIQWMQQDPDGYITFNYRLAHAAFTPQYRYAPCSNNEHWTRYLSFVVENCAAAGYDGIFVDNNILHCYCPYCRREFRRYLRERYSPAELEARFGSDDPGMNWQADKTHWAKKQPEFVEFLRRELKPGELEETFQIRDFSSPREMNKIGYGYLGGRARRFVDSLHERYSPEERRRRFEMENLREMGLETPGRRRLWMETQRFWGWSIAENLLRLARAARKHRSDFLVLPNWGEFSTVAGVDGRRLDAKNVTEWARGCVYLMFEEDGPPGKLAQDDYRDCQLEYKYALANGTSPVILAYGRYDAAITELALAEAAASGGGAFVELGYAHPEIRKRYRDFYARYPELFEGLESLAQVALIYRFNELHLENPAHLRHLHHLKKGLLDGHVLFDILRERDLARLSRYRVALLPQALYLEEPEAEALAGWVRAGGNLILTGDLHRAFRAWFATGARSASVGKGRAVWTTSPEADLSDSAVSPRRDLPGLRFNAYCAREGGRMRCVLHVLNFEAAEVRDLPVSLPVAGKSARLRLFEPGEQPVPLDGQILDGRLTFQVPEIRVHKIVEAVIL